MSLAQAYARGSSSALEKLALLWRPGAAQDKFLSLSNRLASLRARNMGVAEASERPLTWGNKLQAKMVSAVVGRGEGKKEIYDGMLAHMRNPSSAGYDPKSRTLFTSATQTPVQKIMGAPAHSPDIKPMLAHHELDEAAAHERLGLNDFKLWKTKAGDTLSDLKAQRKGANPFDLPPVRTLGPEQFQSHYSPEVLLRESNRVFHEATPAGGSAMQGMRSSSGEAAILKGNGLNYGNEYLPEGGRRWNKLMGKLTANRDLKQLRQHRPAKGT